MSYLLNNSGSILPQGQSSFVSISPRAHGPRVAVAPEVVEPIGSVRNSIRNQVINVGSGRKKTSKGKAAAMGDLEDINDIIMHS